MADIFSNMEILPKCWIARIQKYWEKRIPTNIPTSSSTFSFIMTQEEKAAVEEMEKNIDSEQSIIDPSIIPANEAVGGYLGTYDVVGNAGELTLLSPNKLPEGATGAVVYHYNDETSTWDKVDDIEIKDGYVWGTLESFSPIAVFSFRKDSYLDTTQSMLPGDVYVCNGIKTKVCLEDDKIVAISAYGKKTELTEKTYIVGGSYDGSDIESTDIYLENVKVAKIIGGSYFLSNNDHKNHTKSIKVVAKNVTSTNAITGAGIWNCADNVYISVDGCTAAGIGASECYYKKITSMPTLANSEAKLAANQWVKNATVEIKNSKITVVYGGGNNGYNYTVSSSLIIDGGEYEYVCNGQSNGTIDNCYAEIANCKITHLNTNNRGHYGNGNTIVKNCEIVEQYVFADPKESDKDMADVLGKVKVSIDAKSVIKDFCVGAISNKEVTTAKEAEKYIESVTVSRDTAIIYTRNADIILKDLLKIK